LCFGLVEVLREFERQLTFCGVVPLGPLQRDLGISPHRLLFCCARFDSGVALHPIAIGDVLPFHFLMSYPESSSPPDNMPSNAQPVDARFGLSGIIFTAQGYQSGSSPVLHSIRSLGTTVV
jgi:hypothetical protein